MFAEVEFVALGPRTVGSPRELAARVGEAREVGYVIVDEEFEPDLIGVAVPIRDSKQVIVASLNVSAPRFRFVDRVQEAAHDLLEVSAELSHELGAPGAIELPA